MNQEERMKYYKEAQELIRRANEICSQLPELKKDNLVDSLLLKCIDKLNKSNVGKENMDMNRSHSNVRSRKAKKKLKTDLFDSNRSFS
jgi:hypothetical protein